MVVRIDTHHHTKFSKNWSIQSRHIAIFQIFKMAAAATILNFWNCTILLAIWVKKVKTHQHAKFRQNRSIGCEDIKIFRFFKMAAAVILDCRIRKILQADGVWRAQTHHCTKFRQNWSFSCGDRELSNFQNGLRHHLGFLKLRNFIGYMGGEGRATSACQFSLKSVNLLLRY